MKKIKGLSLWNLQQMLQTGQRQATKVLDRQFTGCPTNWTTSYVALLARADGIPIRNDRKTLGKSARNEDIAETNLTTQALVISSVQAS